MNFSKTFDVNEPNMWQILRHFEVNPKIVRAIRSVYQESKSRVRVGHQVIDNFTVDTAVLQGDTLAPFLFIVMLDLVLSRSTDLSECRVTLRDQDQSYIPDLDFADVIVLLDPDLEKTWEPPDETDYWSKLSWTEREFQETKISPSTCTTSRHATDSRWKRSKTSKT